MLDVFFLHFQRTDAYTDDDEYSNANQTANMWQKDIINLDSEYFFYEKRIYSES